MGVAVPQRVDYAEAVDAIGSSARSRRRRSTVAASVLATLAVIAGPLVVGWLGFMGHMTPVNGDALLSPMARRVLHTLPQAYTTSGMVVVPAAGDRGLVSTSPLPRDQIDGAVVNLGVHGLADYGYLPRSGQAPDWLSGLRPQDQVFSDVGTLSFACMRWPGASDCKGTLLMSYGGQRHVFRSGLDVVGSPDQVHTFRALDAGLPTTLLLGSLPPRAVSASVKVGSNGSFDVVFGHTSRPRAVGGATLWWAVTAAPAVAVRFFDSGHHEVGVVTLQR